VLGLCGELGIDRLMVLPKEQFHSLAHHRLSRRPLLGAKEFEALEGVGVEVGGNKPLPLSIRARAARFELR
jgi:hypothetical protein